MDDGAVTGVTTDDAGAARLVVLGGPEDVVVGGTLAGGPVESVTEDAVREFASGLREVPTADWRDALASAVPDGHVEEMVLEADSLTSPPLIEP